MISMGNRPPFLKVLKFIEAIGLSDGFGVYSLFG